MAWRGVARGSFDDAARPLLTRRYNALFIAGGPRMLADLRQTDLSGASPTPYCLTLRALAEEVLAAGGAVGAVGHGVRGLPGEEGARHERCFEGHLDSAAEEVAKQVVAARTPPPAAEEAKSER